MAVAFADKTVVNQLGELVDKDSVKYISLFRNVYEQQNTGDGFSGLDGFLAELDEQIEFYKQGGSHDELLAVRRARFMSSLKKSK